MTEASDEMAGSSRSSAGVDGSEASGTSSMREKPAGTRPSSSPSGRQNQTIRFRYSRRDSASRSTPRKRASASSTLACTRLSACSSGLPR